MLSSLLILLSSLLAGNCASAVSTGGDASHQPFKPQALNLPVVQTAGSRQPAGFTRQPQYSTFSCTGLKWGEHNRYGQPGARHCRFDNVCLNHTSLEWQYYWPLQPEPLFYRQQDGQPQHQFPDDFVNTGHVHMAENSKLNWKPTVVQQPIPAGTAFHKAPVVAYHSANDFLGNFGHVLFDYLFPVFNMLQLLGLYTPEVQIVFAQQQGSNDRIVDQFLTNQDPSRNLGALISRHPLLTKAALAQSSGSGGLTCVHTLVAGAGSLQQTMARTRVMPFRAASFVNVGIPVEQDLGADKPVITILKKHGRRMVENTDEIYARLKLALPQCHVLMVEGEQIATMSIRDQLMLMSATSVLITPSGGLGTVLMFLQPGASAIVFNFYQDHSKHTEQQENIYYWNMEHVDLEYFPIIAEDYSNTTDRPGCENKPGADHFEEQGALLHCNTRLRNLTRLDHVVKGTLRKWAVNHDKPVPQWVEPSAAGSAAAVSSGKLPVQLPPQHSKPTLTSTKSESTTMAALIHETTSKSGSNQPSAQALVQQALSKSGEATPTPPVLPSPAQMGAGRQSLKKHRLRMRSMHDSKQTGS